MALYGRAAKMLAAGFLSASFGQGVEAPPAASSVTISLPEPEPFIPPAQQELAQKAADNFIMEFKSRVARNDRSGFWQKSFSTVSRNYDPKDIPALRHSPAKTNYDFITAEFQNRIFPTSRMGSPVQFASMSGGQLKYVRDLSWAVRSRYNKTILILDLGHGQAFTTAQHETGANIDGVEEAVVVDAVGLQVERQLRREDVVVIKTRNFMTEGYTLNRGTHFKDHDKSLQIRAEMASYLRERFPDATVVFVSLHANRAVTASQKIIPGISGGLVFSYAAKEGGRTESANSSALAASIARNFKLRKATEVRTNDYAVLRAQYADTPAVLVEVGFITNPGDRELLKRMTQSEAIADYYAQGISEGILRYLQDARSTPPVGAQIALNSPK